MEPISTYLYLANRPTTHQDRFPSSAIPVVYCTLLVPMQVLVKKTYHFGDRHDGPCSQMPPHSPRGRALVVGTVVVVVCCHRLLSPLSGDVADHRCDGSRTGNPDTHAEGTGSVRVAKSNPYPYPAYPTHKPGRVLKPVTITSRNPNYISNKSPRGRPSELQPSL